MGVLNKNDKTSDLQLFWNSLESSPTISFHFTKSKTIHNHFISIFLRQINTNDPQFSAYWVFFWHNKIRTTLQRQYAVTLSVAVAITRS